MAFCGRHGVFVVAFFPRITVPSQVFLSRQFIPKNLKFTPAQQMTTGEAKFRGSRYFAAYQFRGHFAAELDCGNTFTLDLSPLGPTGLRT